jgi:hypothetical protein
VSPRIPFARAHSDSLSRIHVELVWQSSPGWTVIHVLAKRPFLPYKQDVTGSSPGLPIDFIQGSKVWGIQEDLKKWCERAIIWPSILVQRKRFFAQEYWIETILLARQIVNEIKS